MRVRAILLGFGTLGLALAGSTGAWARDAATTSGRASVTVAEPIAIQTIEALQFGVIAVSESGGGAITVDPDSGSSSFSGSLASACPSASGCSARPALFGVTGSAGRYYRVDAPASAVAQHESGAGAPLAVSAITLSGTGSSPDASRRLLDEGGRDSFRIGGTLSVPAGTQPGIYRAELTVVVSYD